MPRVLPEDWTLPEITPFNRVWFTSGTLAVQLCVSCQTLQHPPEEVCHACGGTSFGTRQLTPRGTIHSFTTVHHAATRALAAVVPYAVVLVSLDEVPALRVVGNLPGVPLEEIQIGMPVEPVWEERKTPEGEIVRLLQWRRVE